MRPDTNNNNDDGDGEEKDYFAKFEQEPEFRNFVRKLSRCRSIASLDFSKVDTIEDEKGKAEDSIRSAKDYKQTSKQHKAHQNKVIESYKNGENKSGRGEVRRTFNMTFIS